MERATRRLIAKGESASASPAGIEGFGEGSLLVGRDYRWPEVAHAPDQADPCTGAVFVYGHRGLRTNPRPLYHRSGETDASRNHPHRRRHPAGDRPAEEASLTGIAQPAASTN